MGSSERLRSYRYGAGPDVTRIATHQGTPRRIRAVGFDFDHTLGIDNHLERVAFLKILDEIVSGGGTPCGTLEAEIDQIDALLYRQRTGVCSIEDAVEEFAAQHGARDPRGFAGRYKQVALESVDAFVVVEPAAAALLNALRSRGIPYALLTNGWSPLQERKAALAGFEGRVLVSADLGVQKPSAQAFAALAEVLGCPPDAVAYVGDSPHGDIAGALAAGMHAFWYSPGDAPYPQDAPAPTARIRNLTELLGLL